MSPLPQENADLKSRVADAIGSYDQIDTFAEKEVDDLKACVYSLINATELPETIPTWMWLEKNFELDETSELQGTISFDLFPASKFFLNHADNPRTKRMICIVSAQSAKTQNAIMYVLRRLKDRPAPVMWVNASAQAGEEFAKKRIRPAVEHCPPVMEIAPVEDDRWTKRLIQFDTANLMIRGANSRIGLQGDPIGILICDERREWKKGRIDMVRKRTRTFAAAIEISIGVAGNADDDLHADWKEGSQTFIHFKCLKCDHSQPFRFGKEPTPFFPDARAKGGVAWEDNEKTRPNGIWNWKEMKRTARYECESCGHLHESKDKIAMLKTAHEHHRNPDALPKNPSLHWNALLMPWQSCDWGEIAEEFLQAIESMKFGNIERMIAFVTETLGEPWELRNQSKAQGDLLALADIQPYKLGEMWMSKTEKDQIEENSVLFLTFDRQLLEMPYVIRQWRKNGDSRLVMCGIAHDYDEIRSIQHKWKIKNKCTWGDDGGRLTMDFRQTALRMGWQILKGEDNENFAVKDENSGRTYRQGWRATEFDSGVGISSQGGVLMVAYLWSNSWYKNSLYTFFMGKKGCQWLIPKDPPENYVEQVLANEWRERKVGNRIQGEWVETGADHYADCELMQLVVADVGGITRRYLARDPVNEKQT